MRKLAIVLLIVLSAIAAPQEEKKLDPALKALSKFVGGKWVANGQMPIEQVWTWNADKRGITIEATIGKGTTNMFTSKALFGWDPVAKKPYYLDMHGSETTYYGHVTEKDGLIEIRFGHLGSPDKNWVERGRFVSDNQWKATLYQIKDGKENVVVEFDLKRQSAN